MSDEPRTSRPIAPDDGTGKTRRFGGLFSWLRWLRPGRNGDSSLRESVEALIEERGDSADPIDPEERVLIANVLNLNTVTVADTMVPRADISAVEVTTPLNEVSAAMTRQSHSRLPVYHGTLDEVIGMIHIKDVLRTLELANGGKRRGGLRKLVRTVMFVAPSMRVLDLLLQMRKGRIHMALVVDEYGGIDGLVTIEDLVEEIVGEIEEEHEAAAAPRLETNADGTLIVDARLPIEEFEARVGPVLAGTEDAGDVDTLGGFVSVLAGRVPVRGELVVHDATGLEFEVVEADPRRVKQIRVRNVPAPPAVNG